ncbi:MAG: NAD(P)/FAD-dependent oxidoreductase [Deltaproteobacteria bacterium]|nr:NAD(P)/FAD-dependent oxidoreductase [Deltaproteobacteria bacterium]
MTADRVLIVGGGPNGLTAAALLARAGRRVTLFEAGDRLGGLAAESEIVPGFVAPGVHHDASLVRPWVLRRLGLELPRAPRPELILPSAGGHELVVVPAGETLGGASDADQAAWRRFRELIDTVRPAIVRLWDARPLSARDSLWTLARAGWSVRRLGKRAMMELVRVAPMCVADWMRDAFHDERLRAGLALGALEGAFTGPWSAHTALSLLVREALAGDEIVGGGPAVVRALEGAARAAGVELRIGAPVDKILVDRQGVAGVRLSSGEVVPARAVLSTVDPKQTFLRLIDKVWLPLELEHGARVYRMRGSEAVLRLALSSPLVTAAGTVVSHLRTGDTIDDLERAFDAARHRRFATAPALDVRVHGAAPRLAGSPASPGLPAKSLASIRVHAASHDLAGGWTEAARAGLLEATLAVLERACPGARDAVVASELLVPTDLEARFRLSGGHVLHGEHAPDQLLSFRPTLSSGRYATPIPGLWIGGGGSHPGGGLTLAPGALAAQEMLA